MPKPYTPQRPSIDSHPKRDQIQRQLILRTPLRKIVEQFSTSNHPFSKTALAKYRDNYVQPALDAARRAATADEDRIIELRAKLHETCLWLFDEYQQQAKSAGRRAQRKRKKADVETDAAIAQAASGDAMEEQKAHRGYMSDLTKAVTSVAEVLGVGKFDPAARQPQQQPTQQTNLLAGGDIGINVAQAIGLPRDERVPLVARTEEEERSPVIDMNAVEAVESRSPESEAEESQAPDQSQNSADTTPSATELEHTPQPAGLPAMPSR
jgi:hypothetical protein